jgi:hypothetical protein
VSPSQHATRPCTLILSHTPLPVRECIRSVPCAQFECAINKIFGNGATSKHPILYAAHTKLSDEKIYKGTAKALERFLRAQPRVCDQLNITKLYPGGFVALKHYPSKADSWYSPRCEYPNQAATARGVHSTPAALRRLALRDHAHYP